MVRKLRLEYPGAFYHVINIILSLLGLFPAGAVQCSATLQSQNEYHPLYPRQPGRL